MSDRRPCGLHRGGHAVTVGRGPAENGTLNVVGEPMNRFFRRMQRFGKGWSARRSQGEMVNTQPEMLEQSRPKDDARARAKSSGHGKKTADKWNQ
jgi:hypothetical protein